MNAAHPSKLLQQKTAFGRVLGLGYKKGTFTYCPQLRGDHYWIYILQRPFQSKRKISPAFIFLSSIFLQNESLTNLFRKISVNEKQILLIIKRWSGSKMAESWSWICLEYPMSRLTIFHSVHYLYAFWDKDLLSTCKQSKVS